MARVKAAPASGGGAGVRKAKPAQDKALDLISALARGDIGAADTAAGLRREKLDALDLVAALAAQAARKRTDPVRAQLAVQL